MNARKRIYNRYNFINGNFRHRIDSNVSVLIHLVDSIDKIDRNYLLLVSLEDCNRF